jgi:predicted Kef-type K+ transport protein
VIVYAGANELTVVSVTFNDLSAGAAIVEIVPAVIAVTAALAGTALTGPKPSDATATSAMRFRSVFVDIFFLSVSRRREFLYLRLVIQRDLAIAPLHHFLQATRVAYRNLVCKGIYREQLLASKGIHALMKGMKLFC